MQCNDLNDLVLPCASSMSIYGVSSPATYVELARDAVCAVRFVRSCSAMSMNAIQYRYAIRLFPTTPGKIKR